MPRKFTEVEKNQYLEAAKIISNGHSNMAYWALFETTPLTVKARTFDNEPILRAFTDWYALDTDAQYWRMVDWRRVSVGAVVSIVVNG